LNFEFKIPLGKKVV